jgi:DinB superfamily
MQDRTNKVKTRPELEPQNTPYKSAEEALSSFKENREKLINYVKTTKDEMRNHVTQMPFGMIDSYQIVLFISAHCNRHTQQINEVKADPNFPKQ